MPKNDYTINYFKRYSKFYLQDNDICWRVEAIDSISTPGILEVIAVEYYANKDEDDIEAGVVGKLIPEAIDPNNDVLKDEEYIKGETFIKIKTPYTYIFSGVKSLEWHVEKDIPVKLKFDKSDPRIVSLIWTQGYSGQFDLYYGNYKKTIVVESLF
jgi:hypothetical protein